MKALVIKGTALPLAACCIKGCCCCAELARTAEELAINVPRELLLMKPPPLTSESCPERVSKMPCLEDEGDDEGDVSLQVRRRRKELHISRNSPRNCRSSPRLACSDRS